MKLALIIALLTSSAFANDTTNNILVECEMNDITTVRQFSITASFDVASNSFENKNLDLTLRALGPARDSSEVSVTRDGTIVSYPADVMTKFPFYAITSVEKESEVQLINLLVDFPTPLASTLRLSSGETFRSTCKTVK